MLPRSRRVTRPEDFRAVLRRGRRAGRRRLVVHALTGLTDAPHPARAGLVVGKAVGPSVVRHRVSRHLRHLLRERLEAVAAGTDLVVRAQPAAAGATSAELAEDLDAALTRLGLSGRRRNDAPRSLPGARTGTMEGTTVGRRGDHGEDRVGGAASTAGRDRPGSVR